MLNYHREDKYFNYFKVEKILKINLLLINEQQ